jgi:hypothetical protein
MDIKQKRKAIEAEFVHAHYSRAKGNEGRARVCARRAAGLAIGIFFEQCMSKSPPKSAYSLLQWFSQREEIPEHLKLSAQRLTERVTPEYKLPHNEDPIEDAQRIVTTILEGKV